MPSLAQVEQVIRLEEAVIPCCLAEKRRGGWVVFSHQADSSELAPMVPVVVLGK